MLNSLKDQQPQVGLTHIQEVQPPRHHVKLNRTPPQYCHLKVLGRVAIPPSLGPTDVCQKL